MNALMQLNCQTAELPQAMPIQLHMSRLTDLPALFVANGYTKGAEIGTERGQYAEVLCQRMPNLELLCVDAWQAYRGYREHVTQLRLDDFYHETCARLASFNAEVVRGFSLDIASVIPDGSLDFVYIDANHTLPYVIADLTAWVPKVRKGGTVSGHDWGRSSVGHVREAVQAWTSAYRIAPWYVLTGDRSPSWLWVKT